MMRGLEPFCWEERLGELGLLSLGRRRAAGRPYCSLPVPEGASKKAEEAFKKGME